MRSLALLTLLTIGCGGSGGGGIDANGDGGSSGDGGLLPVSVTLDAPSATYDGSLWTVHFVLDDKAYPTRVIASVDDVSLLWSFGSADATGFHCAQAPWVVPAKTSAIDVQLGAGAGGPTLLFVSCGMPNTLQPFYLPSMMPPSGETILVEVDGTLNDGTRFKAATGANP
jgi:hypothetical protein